MRAGTCIVLAATFTLAACRALAPPAPRSAPDTRPPARTEDLRPAAGEVDVVAFVDPNAPTRRLGPHEDYVAPRPSQQNALPPYPQEVLALRLPTQRVGVRFTIASDGRVRNVTESAVATTSENVHPRIVQLVHETVARWCFSPPIVRTFTSVSERSASVGAPTLEREDRISVLYDLQFTFEVIDGRGIVRAGRE